MRIVMNERKHAEAFINGKLTAEEQKNLYTIEIMAKYYRAEGYDDKELRAKIKELIQEKYPGTSDCRVQRWTKKALETSKKYPLYEIDEIIITKPEIEFINTLHSAKVRKRNLRKLAFTLLCFAKFESMRGRKDYWVKTERKHIFKAAKITGLTQDKQRTMINALYNAGYIEFGNIGNVNTKVLGVKDGETEISVKDINECGYIFDEKYNGKKFVRCADCGVMVLATNGRIKRCRDCAKERNKQLSRERMKRLLAAKKHTA